MGIILVYCMLFCAIYTAPFIFQYDMNNSSKQDMTQTTLTYFYAMEPRREKMTKAIPTTPYAIVFVSPLQLLLVMLMLLLK